VISTLVTRCARVLRRAALPLAAYYSVTLALPVANGAARASGAFVEHALLVLAIPPLVILIACGTHAVVRRVASAWLPYQPRLAPAAKPCSNPWPVNRRS
jgi:hypothetical protein